MDIKDIKDARVTHAGLLQHNNDGTTELQKITHAGLIARSPQGTAAKGMNIRGNEDLWVEIQANTFRNWVNEHLKDTDMQVSVVEFRANDINVGCVASTSIGARLVGVSVVFGCVSVQSGGSAFIHSFTLHI